VRWIILGLLAALVATCGQKGPLTLPEEPQAGQHFRVTVSSEPYVFL